MFRKLMSLTKICNNNIKPFVLFTCFWFLSYNETESKLLSYQSEYEVSLGDTDIVRVPGKTYVDKAYGQLFIDWINNCDNSWVSNQRMMTRFINSYGVGTVNEINYSINENINGENMEFVLEVKENAELVERTIGKAIKDNNLVVKFPQTDKKDLTFPNDVVFPHTFLKEITNKLNGDEKIIVKKSMKGPFLRIFLISRFFSPTKLLNILKLIFQVKLRISLKNLGCLITKITNQPQYLNKQSI